MSGRELFDRPSYNINIVRIGSISLDKRIRSCLAMPCANLFQTRDV